MRPGTRYNNTVMYLVAIITPPTPPTDMGGVYHGLGGAKPPMMLYQGLLGAKPPPHA